MEQDLRSQQDLKQTSQACPPSSSAAAAEPAKIQPCGSGKKRPHVSSSAIDCYLDKCGHYYERRYILKESVPPTTQMVRGSAIHTGSEVNFKQKIESHKDLSASKIQEITAAAFDERIKTEGYFLTTKEESVGASIALGRVKDRAVLLSDIYTQHIAPAHQPVMVEEFQRIRLNDDLDLLAKLDLLNDKRQIVDLKSSKRSISQAELDSSTQYTIYAMVHRAITKEDPAGIVQENIVDAPKNPKHRRLETFRGEAHYKKLIDKINLFLHGTKTGVFLPAAKGAWYCNEEHCGYARTCKFYQFYQKGGGKVQVPFWMKFKKKAVPNGKV